LLPEILRASASAIGERTLFSEQTKRIDCGRRVGVCGASTGDTTKPFNPSSAEP
jgi:hypothetical protein